MSGNDVVWLPEVIVFAGPNGSGKSTITRLAMIIRRSRSEYLRNAKTYIIDGVINIGVMMISKN